MKNERIKVYRMLYKQLKTIDKSLFVYLCMERQDVWRAVTGLYIEDNEVLMGLFDARIRDLYGGDI
jgi:hypothetical protein